jgi:hypothetical protein
MSNTISYCYRADQFMDHATIEMASDTHRHSTAIKFIHLIKELNTVFLQDMAGMLVADPARQSHPIFSHLTVFQMDEWRTFLESVQRTNPKYD